MSFSPIVFFLSFFFFGNFADNKSPRNLSRVFINARFSSFRLHILWHVLRCAIFFAAHLYRLQREREKEGEKGAREGKTRKCTGYDSGIQPGVHSKKLMLCFLPARSTGALLKMSTKKQTADLHDTATQIVSAEIDVDIPPLDRTFSTRASSFDFGSTSIRRRIDVDSTSIGRH